MSEKFCRRIIKYRKRRGNPVSARCAIRIVFESSAHAAICTVHNSLVAKIIYVIKGVDIMSCLVDYQLMSSLGQVFIPGIMRINSNFKEKSEGPDHVQVSMTVDDERKFLIVKYEGKTNENKHKPGFSGIDEFGRFIIRKNFRELLDIRLDDTESLVIQLIDENTIKIRKLAYIVYPFAAQ